MALGLVSSETLDDFWVQNTRRRIFYSYPNGTAPLTGLLSLMDNRDTPLPQFGWDEERWSAIKTQTMATGQPTADVTFYNTGTTTTAGGPATLAAGSVYRVYVDDSSNFQIDDNVCIFQVALTGGGLTNVVGRVTATDTTTSLNFIEIKIAEAPSTTVLNTAASNEAKWVYQLGSAYAEGARSRTGRIKTPTELVNYTQIHKTPYELTRTALKEPLKYDKTGAYQDISKSNGIDHMAGMEYTAFFGVRKKETAVDPDTGATVRRGFTGGLLWFMKQWELGSTANGGAFDYGQANVSTQTDWVTYTNKRIIQLGGANITGDQLEELHSRVFEKTNSADWVKLCLCGPGYLAKVAAKYRREIVWTSLREEGFDGFNFKFQRVMTNAGEIAFKVHPLFNDPIMRNSAFYIDVGYMGYRPLTDTDTDIQPMIQMPDADKRKDQWLTEYGFEIPYPEANLYVENLGGVTL